VSLGHTVLVLVIYVLACARLTRLINGDTILDPIRVWILARARDDARKARSRQRWNMWVYFVECPWCVGWWVSVAAAYLPVHLIGWPWWALFPVALAGSHLIGVFAFAADTDEIEVTDQPA